MVGVGLALLELDHLISAEHTVGTEESRLKRGTSNSGERSVHCWLSQVIKYQSVLSLFIVKSHSQVGGMH